MACKDCIYSTFKGNSKMGDCTFVVKWPELPDSMNDHFSRKPVIGKPQKLKITRNMGEKCKTFFAKPSKLTVDQLNLGE